MVSRRRPFAGDLAQRLVADDRRQPGPARLAVAQRVAFAPRPQRRVLGDVVRLGPVLRIAKCEAEADLTDFLPVPGLVRICSPNPVIETLDLHDAEQTSRFEQ